jgi:tRNA(Ile)-lysidine synthase
MSQLSAHLIETAINQHDRPPAHIYIGYSGGVDSHVLLHLCATLTHWRDKLIAVHIHHGLQDSASAWAEHSEKQARALGIQFCLLHVNATAQRGESPEEAARNARYNALRELISTNDVLLIAQHQEDQLETVLLQLFRGGGLRGLSGIPHSHHFGQGLILRPLLNVSKQEINAYAHAQQLHWIEDPSNNSEQYDRNFLRNAVIPLLKQRWPSLDKTVARSAHHCSEAQFVVAAIADELFDPVFNSADKTLSISELKAHKPTRQQLVIRHWFAYLGLKMPTQTFIERLLNEVVLASPSSAPLLVGQNHCVRRYRNSLYCLPHMDYEPISQTLWPTGQTQLSIGNQHILSYSRSAVGIDSQRWHNAVVTIKARTGGERIRLPKRKSLHTLKKLFQEAGIPPWERELIPLIYLNDELAAIGDKWISAEFYSETGDNGCIRLSLTNTLINNKEQ